VEKSHHRRRWGDASHNRQGREAIIEESQRTREEGQKINNLVSKGDPPNKQCLGERHPNRATTEFKSGEAQGIKLRWRKVPHPREVSKGERGIKEDGTRKIPRINDGMEDEQTGQQRLELESPLAISRQGFCVCETN